MPQRLAALAQSSTGSSSSALHCSKLLNVYSVIEVQPDHASYSSMRLSCVPLPPVSYPVNPDLTALVDQLLTSSHVELTVTPSLEPSPLQSVPAFLALEVLPASNAPATSSATAEAQRLAFAVVPARHPPQALLPATTACVLLARAWCRMATPSALLAQQTLGSQGQCLPLVQATLVQCTLKLH